MRHVFFYSDGWSEPWKSLMKKNEGVCGSSKKNHACTGTFEVSLITVNFSHECAEVVSEVTVMEQIFIESNDKPDESKRNFGGSILLGLAGTAIVGLYVATLPFLTPAVRKICLPFVPATNTQVKNVMTALRGKCGKVVDLGSGDGRIVIEAAKNGFIAEGVELNVWLVWYSRWSAWRQGVSDRTHFIRQDLWKVDLSHYDNVVIFGIQEMMEELEIKALRELTRSATITACRFPLPHWTPTAVIGSGIDTVWIYHQK